MITTDGPKVVEFNCRFGDPETQVVLPRMKSDIIPIMRACCTGKLAECDIEYDERPCVTVVLASGGYPGAYAKGIPIEGIEDAETLEGVVVFHAGTRIDNGSLVTNGGRVLNVTAIAEDLPKTIAKAYEALGKISIENAQYRTDIGQKALNRLG
jgi:phosphoribosylamine--glycine ligase